MLRSCLGGCAPPTYPLLPPSTSSAGVVSSGSSRDNPKQCGSHSRPHTSSRPPSFLPPPSPLRLLPFTLYLLILRSLIILLPASLPLSFLLAACHYPSLILFLPSPSSIPRPAVRFEERRGREAAAAAEWREGDRGQERKRKRVTSLTRYTHPNSLKPKSKPYHLGVSGWRSLEWSEFVLHDLSGRVWPLPPPPPTLLSHPIPSRPFPSYPLPSYPNLSHAILSHPTPSDLVTPHAFVSRLFAVVLRVDAQYLRGPGFSREDNPT